MEEMGSLWSYQESVDELKLKIHYTSQELEAVKARANEEMNRNTESVKQLLHLLKLVCHERDEARDQIQNLFLKIMPNSMHNNTMMISDSFAIDQFHPSPLMKPAKAANSSIAESNSISDAYNHSNSSPVDSLFDPVTSPEFPNINTNSFVFPKIDHATLMMESMIKGKALPKKGKLLKAVMEAGPLIETLLAARPVPNWPKAVSPLPSFSISPNGVQYPMTTTMMISEQSQPFVDMSCGGSGFFSFESFDDVNFGQVEKRQRFQ